MANRTVSVALKAEVGDFINKMGTAARGAKQFGQELGGLGKNSPAQLNDVAMAVGGVGVALLGVAGYAVKTAMEFDKQMSAVGAATNANVADMGRLREAALEAGKATTFSATEAAKGQTELAKAGVSTADILGGGLTGALDLAAAGQMAVADSAELAATAMTQFGLSGGAVPHIADLLAAGAGKAQGSVKDMGMALNQSGLVANQFGLTIEDTTGTLAMFAHAGLVGSDAGTSFKQMLLMLASPSKEAKREMENLGIAAYDAEGKFVGITDMAEQLKTRLAGLTEEQRNAALATIFGADAIRAASILYKNGAAGVDEWRDKVNDSGYAADQAAKLTDNLAGDIERLKGSMETMAISAGSGANGGLRLLVQALDGVVTGFSNLPGPVQTSLTVLAGVGGASLLAVAGLLKMKQTVGDALDALSAMGPMGDKASGAIGKIGSAAAKLSVVGLVGFGLYEGLAALMDATSKGSRLINRDLDKLTEGLIRFARTGQTTGEAAKVIGAGFNDFADNYTKAITAVGNKDTKGAAQAVKDIKSLDESFAKIVQSGNPVQARTLVDQFTQSMLSQGYSLDQINSVYLPKYNAAAGDLAASNTGLAQGFLGAGQASQQLTSGLEAAIQAGQTLKQTFDALNGGFINSTQAAINVEAALDEVTESLQKNGANLDLNTSKGREHTSTILAVATAARDAAQAKYEETGSLAEAKGAYDGYIQRLRGTYSQAQLTQGGVGALIDRISQMPSLKSTTITLNDDASWKILNIQRGLNALQNRTITVTTRQNVVTGQVQTTTRSGPRFERWGGVTEYAASGLLREAATYTPRGAARYGFAEPATQGEAFIPRNGDRLRSLGILTKAASWYGANISTGGIPRGGASRMQTTRIIIDGTGVLEGLRREVYIRGGNVQTVVGRNNR